MKIELIDKLTKVEDGRALVVLSGGLWDRRDQSLPEEMRNMVSKCEAADSHRDIFGGKLGEFAVYRETGSSRFRHILFVGVQKDELIESECVRRAAAHLVLVLKREKFRGATVSLGSNVGQGTVQAFIEGLKLASYEMKDLTSRGTTESFEIERVDIYCRSREMYEVELTVGDSVSEAVNFARKLGDLPPGHLTPKDFSRLVGEAVASYGIEFSEWDESRLIEEKMNGLLTVSKGSVEEPRMVILRYNGADHTQRPVCLVGKGITFDSGGLNIKSTKNMEDMRYDMCGAAAVVAVTIAAARLKIPINIVAYAALAENMPGPGAAKPGDVYVARNGKSIEVMNTDAEGRLVLSDAICLVKDENPRLVIDVATLTGGVVAALGDVCTGVFCNHEETYRRLLSSSQRAGEMIWRLPLYPEYAEDIKGQFADVTNSSVRTGASSATAAAFLAQFVPANVPWIHLDIAGTAQHAGHRVRYAPKKGASGAMIRTLVDFVEQIGAREMVGEN